jgi:poly-gamma-glutamate synthesis protein (capsule biosynthesis protein)
MNGANNHAFDQGKIGIDYTKAHLWEQGVGLVGTGSDLDEAWQPQVITARNIKIGFLGASYGPRNGYIANIKDKDRLKQAIADLGMRSDFIVVTMHAGAEYTREPHSSQREFAQAAIDYGADLVIGAHPHWIQPIEQYNGKYIFYSLGNFVFDQGWSQDTKEGLALKITLDSPKSSNSLTSSSATIDDLQGTKVKAQLKQIELVPVIIERYCCPRLATETETTAILQKINVTETIIEAE